MILENTSVFTHLTTHQMLILQLKLKVRFLCDMKQLNICLSDQKLLMYNTEFIRLWKSPGINLSFYHVICGFPKVS